MFGFLGPKIKEKWNAKEYAKMGLWIIIAVIAFIVFSIIKSQMDHQSRERIRNQMKMQQQSSQMVRTASNTEAKDRIPPISNGTSKAFAETYDGWITVKAGEELEFQIPPTMEVQSEAYQKAHDSPEFRKSVNANCELRMVAQQKGLNDNIKEAYSHYVRAVLKIIPMPEYVHKWGEKIEATNQELKEFNDLIVSSAYDDDTIKLVGISQPTRISHVNNIPCLYTRYETQYNNNPFVINEIYHFFNGKKCYTFLTMIRSTEYEHWTSGKNDVRAIVKTIRPNRTNYADASADGGFAFLCGFPGLFATMQNTVDIEREGFLWQS